jgi:hypothetical protein
VRRNALILIALVLLALPAAASATTSTVTNASLRCTALRAQIGSIAFGQSFASLGACIRVVTPLEVNNATAAAAVCRLERASASFPLLHGGKTFARFYGRNALAGCVVSTARGSSVAERKGAPSPAQTCTQFQGQLGIAQFTKSYGSYGGCVAWVAQNGIGSQLTAASTCEPQRIDPGFSVAHGGKTFEQFYGTPPTGANAFGLCVVANAVLPAVQLQPQTQQPAPPTAECGQPGTMRIPQILDCPVAGAA